MSSDLISSYPEGEYLIGNFVEYYTDNFEYFDRNVVRKFGDRGLKVDSEESLDSVVLDWIQDVNSIVFSHLNDWAKMYSASIKDYEPLWNVDGTVINTYGKTKKTDTIGQKHSENIYGQEVDVNLIGQQVDNNVYGATQDTIQHGQQVESNVIGQEIDSNVYGAQTNNTSIYKTTYPDTTERKTDKTINELGSHTDQISKGSHTDKLTKNQYTDIESSISHTDELTKGQRQDQLTKGSHTDQYNENQHIDLYENDQHEDVERRTGNIGITKSTELVESEYKLRTVYNFFDIIFKFMIKEMGVIYYDWHRC